METPNLPAIRELRPAWNKGRMVGQKRPLNPKHELSSRFELHPTLIHFWKCALLKGTWDGSVNSFTHL